MLILDLFEEQLTDLIGQEPFQIRVLMRKLKFFSKTVPNIQR